LSNRLDELMQRRAALIALSDEQRSAVATHIAGLGKPIAIADRGLGWLRYLRSHPLALGALTAAIVVLRRRGLWNAGRHLLSRRGDLVKWGQRGLLAWRTWQAVRGRRRPA